jgi:hypothetical protein
MAATSSIQGVACSAPEVTARDHPSAAFEDAPDERTTPHHAANRDAARTVGEAALSAPCATGAGGEPEISEAHIDRVEEDVRDIKAAIVASGR